MNLITLELRKHRLLTFGLALLLLVWVAWLARGVSGGDPLLTLGLGLGSLLAIAPFGVLVPIVLARALAGEAAGPLAFLLESPRSGWAHVAARFGVGFAVLGVYYAVLVVTVHWVAAAAGVRYDAWLPLAVWVYTVAGWAAPLLALGLVYGLLLSAYRPGRGGQIVAVAASAGVLAGWSWLGRFALERLGFLPQLPLPHLVLPEKVGRFFGITGGALDLKAGLEPLVQSIPTAPVWVGLVVTLALLVVAARLWEEAEWA
ncbi:hypothetical protein [Oceanithermus desulfurans]|uniref:Uncharacterized protein n=2 Tax=Oceanithermus desulfurans TaxID=227924 RepID=A0A511RJ51_9DEIN|nr:hypothetical protein [Oceanithermus desulfurans]MBB6029245.1 hypothetical protein [Oceanithermus desulfurans]GEM89117.1 hypothetical protein ODE01S_05510 [Oceanithermus desulfurans NBRC 100063]